jgi:hypothetical protein
MPQVHHTYATTMHKAYNICVATFGIVVNPAYPDYTNVDHVILDPAY